MDHKRPSMVGLLRWALVGAAAGAGCALLFINPPRELRMRSMAISAVFGMIAAATLWELLYNRDNLADS
jgi:hypothetical protein